MVETGDEELAAVYWHMCVDCGETHCCRHPETLEVMLARKDDDLGSVAIECTENGPSPVITATQFVPKDTARALMNPKPDKKAGCWACEVGELDECECPKNCKCAVCLEV